MKPEESSLESKSPTVPLLHIYLFITAKVSKVSLYSEYGITMVIYSKMLIWLDFHFSQSEEEFDF